MDNKFLVTKIGDLYFYKWSNCNVTNITYEKPTKKNYNTDELIDIDCFTCYDTIDTEEKLRKHAKEWIEYEKEANGGVF